MIKRIIVAELLAKMLRQPQRVFYSQPQRAGPERSTDSCQCLCSPRSPLFGRMLIMVRMTVMLIKVREVMLVKMIYICGRVVSGETGVVKDVGALIKDYI